MILASGSNCLLCFSLRYHLPVALRWRLTLRIIIISRLYYRPRHYVAQQSFGSTDCGTCRGESRLPVRVASKLDKSSAISALYLGVSIIMESVVCFSKLCTRYECIKDHEFVSVSEFSVAGVKYADSKTGVGNTHGQTSGKESLACLLLVCLSAYLLIVVTKQLHGMR